MKIATTTEYAATPEEVFAVLADQSFQEAKCAATAAVSHSATVSTSGADTLIRTERVLPANDLPDFARSMVGDTLKIVETQTWGPAGPDGSRSGRVQMSVAGAPVTLDGALRLAASGEGAVETLDAELRAKLPLIGGKIEKAAAPAIREAFEIEGRTAQEWLAR